MVGISSTVGFQFLYIVLFVILLIEVGVINTLIVGLKKIHVTICWSLTLGIHLFIKQGICFLLWDKMKLDKDSYTSHQLETLKKWLVAPKGEVGRISWNFNRILFTGITFIVCNSFHLPSLVGIEPRILSIISSALFSLFWLKGINIPFFPKMYS